MTRSNPFTVEVVRQAGNWLARSTAPGVTLATDFSTDDEVLPHRFANGSPAQVAEFIKRVTRHVDDGVPCLRIASVEPAVGGDQQGQSWRRRFKPISEWPNDGDGFGTAPFWIQFGVKIPASRLIPFAPGKGTWKFAIIANMSLSNPWGLGGQSSNNRSHVLTNGVQSFWKDGVVGGTILNANFPSIYVHTDAATNGAAFTESIPGGISGSDINLSPGWDRGPQFADIHERFCSYRFPMKGCPLWPVDTWVWFQLKIHTRTFGGTEGNEFEFSWCPEGETKWTTLQRQRNYSVSNREDHWPNGFNAIWLTPYETNRTIAGGVDSHILYRHLIVSTEEPALP